MAKRNTCVTHTKPSLSTVEMRAFLNNITCGHACEPITMREAPDWHLKNGAISHRLGGYFNVVSVVLNEPHSHPLVLLYQPQSAFNGLLTTTIHDEPHILLQGRVEPGNTGVAQYGPTVQSTPANYLRIHGGKATPYLDLFFHHEPRVRPAGDWTELDLGSRYLLKNKRLVWVEAVEPVLAEPNFVWTPASVVKKAVLESTLLNTDLRSLLAVIPWSWWPIAQQPDDLGAAAQASICRPIRSSVIGRILVGVGSGSRPVEPVRLEELESWELNEYGLFEREPREQGFDVQFFRIEAPTREVVRWTQPLINSDSRGKVVLALTVSDGALLALISVRAEPGLSTGSAVFPSYVSPPGQRQDPVSLSLYEALRGSRSATVAQTVESDEGGRFFRDESDFEVYLVAEPSDFGQHYDWLTLSELKCLLGISNACSIQLRCIASMLLGLL